MPYLELPPPVNGRYDNAVKYLIGIMLFPDSAERRAVLAEAYAVEFILSFIKNSPHIPVDSSFSSFLNNHKSPGIILEEAAIEFGNAPTLSGALLILSIWTNPEAASLKLSKEALYVGYNNKKKGVSKNTQHKAWKMFKKVSHLWAACAVLNDAQVCEDRTFLPGFPCRESQLSLFMALAEFFRERGERLRPPRTRNNEYILDSNSTWKLHPSTQLEPCAPFYLETMKQHPFVGKVLDARSPRYKKA